MIQTLAIRPEKIGAEKPQPTEAGKTTQDQWKAVNTAFTAPQSQKLEFEPEYDPKSLDDEQAPIFDLGSREV